MNEFSHGEYQSAQSNQNQNEQQNLILLLQNPQKYFEIFLQIYDKANDYIQLQKYPESSEYLLKCCEMIQIGKNLIKKFSKYWPLCVYINLAFVYQNDWKIQKTNQYLQKAQQIITSLIIDSSQQNKQQRLNLTMRLVKLKYQQCAVLSQLNQHQKALSVCQSALPFLKENIQTILNHAKKQYGQSQKQDNQYGVRFGVKVYSFAEEILNNLLSKMVVSCEAAKLSTTKRNSSMEFYYWQKNPQRNEKQLRDSFVPTSQKQQSAKRSILGVTKQKTWINEFNIGYLMKMSQTDLSEWEKHTPLEEYLFKQKIYEYVIYTSVGYFTMATEIRFMDNTKKTSKIEEKIKSKHEEIKKKYGYQEKSQYFALSESHHLTSISIVTQNIQTLIPYLSHIIKSYDKHYIFKKKLDQIMAIPEESVLEGSKISHIRQNSRSASKNSNLANSIQKSQHKSNQKVRQTQEQYGCSYNNKSKLKSRVSSSSNNSEDYLKERMPAKSQRKTFNNIYQTYVGMDNSLRHKSTTNMRSAQKLSRTLKPKTKRKNLTQQSINQIRDSLECIQTGTKKKTMKINKTSPSKGRQKEKDKQKQKQKDRQKQKEKQKQKLFSSRKNSQKKQSFKNNLKQKISLASYQGQGQLHVKHKSCTSFKLVFKKKK